ncbi:MAG: MaoC family dehydratase [Halorientalis sp.]
MYRNTLELSRAAMTAYDPSGPTDDEETTEESPEIEPGADRPTWEVERSTDDVGDLGVGDRVSFSKTISDDDVQSFAAASGDTNPLHLDDEYAAETRFGGRIAHGTLVSGLISAALARLPGTVVYLSQDMEFLAPVRIGDRVTAEVELVEDLGGGRLRLSTTIYNDDDPCIDGEAVVLVPDSE